MTNQEFMALVLWEYKKRSYLTMKLSNRQEKKFRHWFYKKCKKHYGMDKEQAKVQLEKFKRHYNLTNGKE